MIQKLMIVDFWKRWQLLQLKNSCQKLKGWFLWVVRITKAGFHFQIPQLNQSCRLLQRKAFWDNILFVQLCLSLRIGWLRAIGFSLLVWISVKTSLPLFFCAQQWGSWNELFNPHSLILAFCNLLRAFDFISKVVIQYR